MGDREARKLDVAYFFVFVVFVFFSWTHLTSTLTYLNLSLNYAVLVASFMLLRKKDRDEKKSYKLRHEHKMVAHFKHRLGSGGVWGVSALNNAKYC